MNKPLLKKIIICFCLILIGFLLGKVIDLRNNRSVGGFREMRLRENYKYINPLLECEGSISNYTPTSELEEALKKYIDQRVDEGKVAEAAVYYRDLNNGPWFSINRDMLFSPASLIKVPMMIAVLKKAETSPELLNKKVKNTVKNGYEGINYIPREKLEFEKEYTVEDLISRMIIYSDTVAYDLLTGVLDSKSLVDVYTDLGIDLSRALKDPTGNILSIFDYSSFFRVLYNASYLSDTMSEKALGILAKSDFKDGLVASLPGKLTVAHKFGERYYLDTGVRQLHDCGIVYSSYNPYMLCVMTKGSSFNDLSAIISKISSMVYQYFPNNK